ncbi:sensor histidine kinase [Fodinicola feengrottensis]|uniref:histidine kinase n=1 Tax=Fodinicola feengrottensis TaxID=435914 RepID=A0ABP4V905_9ACTN|nr:histidine kinase [Fodinicola feengrottensis]
MPDVRIRPGSWRLAGGIVVALVVLLAFDASYAQPPFSADPLNAGLVPILAGAAGLIAVTLAWPRGRSWLAAFTLVLSVVSLTVTGWVLAVRPHLGILPFTETAALLGYILCDLRWLRGWRNYAVVGLAAVATIALPVRIVSAVPTDPGPAIISGSVMWVLGTVIAALVGLYLRNIDEQRTRWLAAMRHAQRLELARDLHDFVAHHVSGIIVQAQASQVVAETDPVLAAQALRRIEDAGTAALASLRRTVRMLRDVPDGDDAQARTPAHGVADLPEMVERFSGSGRATARLDLGSGVDDDLPPEVTTSAYRIVLEALTNVRKHAPHASTVDVRVHHQEGELEVVVDNDGVRAGGEQHSGGYGLIGLTERVETVGGTLAAGPREPAGWRVLARLPIERRLG